MALLGQALLQILQLALIGQAAKPKQVAGLFKIRMIGQFMNIDAAIGKNSTVSIDIANAGIGGDNSFHAFGAGGAGDAGHSLSLKRIGCGSRARTFARNATFFYTRKGAQIPYSLTTRWSRQGHDYAGQMLNAVLPRICCWVCSDRGSARNSSRFFLTSGTPGPGQSVPKRVL